MTPDDAATFKSIADTLLSIGNSNSGGFVLSWLVIGGLVYAVYRLFSRWQSTNDARFADLQSRMTDCQAQHAECQSEKNELAMALYDLASGRRAEARSRAIRILGSEPEA